MNQQIGNRDVRLDALRGLMLVVIAIDHVPSMLRKFTYESLGFVSAAEGFVFLSGYVAGMIYTSLLLRAGQQELWRRVTSRAVRIYVYHVAVFAILLAGITLGILSSERFEHWVPLFYQNPTLALFLGSTLTYQPIFMDILPMYSVFIIATPLLLKMFINNRALVVLNLSIGLWVLAQCAMNGAITEFAYRFFPINLGNFDIFAWQLVYIGGLFLGFRRCSCKPSNHRINRSGFVFCCVLALVFLSFRHGLAPTDVESFIEPFVAKTTLGPLRLVNFLVLAFLLSQELIWPKNAFWVKSLAYLGRHSLQVFSFNILCVYFVADIYDCWMFPNQPVNILVVLMCVLGLYPPAWVHENRARVKCLFEGWCKEAK